MIWSYRRWIGGVKTAESSCLDAAIKAISLHGCYLACRRTDSMTLRISQKRTRERQALIQREFNHHNARMQTLLVCLVERERQERQSRIRRDSRIKI